MRRSALAAALVVCALAAPARAQLSPPEIQRVVRAHVGAIRQCYEVALRRTPSTSGRLSLRFTIARDGAVRRVHVDTGGPPTPLSDCIAHEVKRWRFPPPLGGGEVTVTYPFNVDPSQ